MDSVLKLTAMPRGEGNANCLFGVFNRKILIELSLLIKICPGKLISRANFNILTAKLRLWRFS